MADLDLKSLSDEFGIIETDEIIDVLDEVSDTSDEKDPDTILLDNIDKANMILDRIIEEMHEGGLKTSRAEVASLLVNAITNAVDKMYAGSFNFENVQHKNKMLVLKEKELLIKNKALDIKKGIGDTPTNQENYIITDRETIMKLFKDKKLTKQIQNGGE